jgi:predicted amidohydrolase/GNAT superfamily N-acetyltransferase
MSNEEQSSEQASARLELRQAVLQDIDAIVDLSRRVYGGDFCYTAEMVHGQLNHFPRGQFVVVYEAKIVGYCATFRVDEKVAFAKHTWREITGGGYAARHDAEGDWLYGMEVCVDPELRGLRIGRRLYDARKMLCKKLGLKGIVFGGRLPGFRKHRKTYSSAEAYVEAVFDSKISDPTLNFQRKNGFELIGILQGYLPSDFESMGCAAHMCWYNPMISTNAAVRESARRGRLPDSARIAVIQYQQRRVDSFETFAENVEYFIDVVGDYRADFAVLPEMFTLQLLSVAKRQLDVSEAIDQLTSFTPRIRELLSRLAVSYNVNIIGGSHITRQPDGTVVNACYVCLRDGSVHERHKIHITPSERDYWQVQGGRDASIILTDCGPIGVMICYDSEFPELARHLVDQGALMLFVPFCTDVREAYLRVRYSCQARAVENQCFIALAGNVGNLPSVGNMDIQYAQSCILAPCDFIFGRDGIAADTTPNTEMVAFADVHIDDLITARNAGSVRNLKDRRFDLYQVRWAP